MAGATPSPSYAIGANREAALFAGVRRPGKAATFAITGFTSAPCLHTGCSLRQRPRRNATGLELAVIAAVLLGGVDFNGGRGTIAGAFAGVFLLGTLQNVMSLLNVSAESQTVVTGLLLVVSVLAPRVAGQIAAARAKPVVTP